MLAFVIQNHSHRAGADLGRELVGRLACHGSTFSGVGASDQPGAVHLQVIRHQGGDEFRSCALRLFSRLEWSHSPPIGSIAGCWMTSPNCAPSFGSWQPVRRHPERGLPLSVVSKRLATLERRAEVLLFAT